MKRFLTFFLSLLLFSCSSDDDELIKKVTLKFNFTQNWDGTDIEQSDISTTEFTNKLGTKLTIEQLRYLISKITLTDGLGNTVKNENYNLIDISKSESLTADFSEQISEGNYNLSMTFGFNNDDNQDGIYTDLNTASWNVPAMLGGGYHFMQLDGKFKNTDNELTNFNFHAIKAVDKSDPNNLQFENTFFSVDLGTISIKNNATIEIKMNVAQWFKNPNDWDLNDKNSNLMMDFDAQKLIAANGDSGVFSLGKISQ